MSDEEQLDAENAVATPIPWLTVALAIAAVAGGVWLARTKLPNQPAPTPTNIPRLAAADGVSFQPVTISDKRPVARITNVQVVDLDGDGRNEILACDAAHDRLVAYRRGDDGQWSEQLIADNLRVPARANPVDIDGDGDLDFVVAILGDLLPTDEVIGSVVLLERDGDDYRRHTLLDDVRRVADVRAGDLDGDGDLDLAVAVFGYARGEVLWLENLGGGRFVDHQLLARPGAIHVPLADYDNDGDLDIGTVVSQDEEELWGLENLGQGKFQPRRLYFTHNFDAGAGGLEACDLDQDGDVDFLVPWGDNLEYGHGWPQPYHGCLWFENLGGWKFQPRRLGRLGGCYAASPGDLDGDGDLDVALISMSNDWADPENASVVWLENDGRQNFTTWKVASAPAELITVACGDLDGDGRDDLVAGRLKLPTSSLPETRRIAAWLSRKSGR